MKIKTVIFPFIGQTVGGSQIATILLIKAISSKFNVIVILFNRGLLEKVLNQYGIKFFLLNTNKNSEFNLFNLKYLSMFGISILHITQEEILYFHTFLQELL